MLVPAAPALLGEGREWLGMVQEPRRDSPERPRNPGYPCRDWRKPDRRDCLQLGRCLECAAMGVSMEHYGCVSVDMGLWLSPMGMAGD